MSRESTPATAARRPSKSEDGPQEQRASTDPSLGLSTSEVAQRVARGQTNAGKDQTSRSLRDIVRANVLTRFNALLTALFVLVLVTGDWRDSLFGGLVVINTSIGIIQELRAKRTLDRLALLHAPRSCVRRDGATVEVALADVVLDDIVELRAGDQVPADGEVVEAMSLEVDESLLTGEADAIPKTTGTAVLSGSIVVAGQGAFRATAVGSDSYARRLTAETRRYTVTSSELQLGVNRLLGWISWSLLVVGPLLLAAEWRTAGNWRDAITPTAAGLVGMIPEGLVLLTTLAFLLGAMTVARHHVLVQQLPAIETLARVDVVCLDKTGTLTEGQIDYSSMEMLVDDTRSPWSAMVAAALGALANGTSPNATLAALGRTFPPPAGWTAVEAGSVAFSSARKWSATRFKETGTWVLGAPEIVLTGEGGPTAESAATRANQLADSGRRVLVLAHSDSSLGAQPDASSLTDIQPLALLLFDERLRPDAARTLRYFREQGIAIKVISGDNARTVGAVAQRVGLDRSQQAFDARELPDDIAAMADVLESHSVFGRVTPHQKRAMVKALQSKGHVVAMTGDGVNDALALKEADIGIAMGSGAAATRAVAPLVLLDSTFSHLPGVVDEGRRVMANIERVANLFVIKNVYSAIISLAVASATLAGQNLSYPFLPRQLTVISALTIGIPAFLLALARSSRRYRPGFLDRVLRFSLPAGALAGIGVFAMYAIARHRDASVREARTAATVTVMMIGLGVLMMLARPLSGRKLVLVATMGALFSAALTVPAAAEFFALTLPLELVGEAMAIACGIGLLVELGWRRLMPPSARPTIFVRRHPRGPRDAA